MSLFNMRILHLVSMLSILVLTGRFSVIAQPYTSFLTGSSADVVTPHEQGLCLMGGATENDQAMRWWLQKAAGGDVVVLRATGSNGYNNYFFNQLGLQLNSVETLVIPTQAAANHPYVAQKVREAEALWIAGGDQAVYHNQWKNSALDSAIRFLVDSKKVALGGTSAGMAIMGQSYFSALNGSITSATALSNPFHANITLGWSDFINHPYLSSTLTDTHFDNPDRRGRLSVFLARMLGQTNSPRGIACDEYTAVCIDSTLKARVFGEWPAEDDNAYFVQVNCVLPNNPENLTAGQALNWVRGNEALKVYRIKGDTAGSGWFNLSGWLSGQGGDWLNWWVSNGQFQQGQGTAFQPCALLDPWVNGLEEKRNYLFPNPAGEWVEVMGIRQNALLRIYDSKGYLVLEQPLTAENHVLHLKGLRPGIYQTSLTQGKEIRFSKLILDQQR